GSATSSPQGWRVGTMTSPGGPCRSTWVSYISAPPGCRRPGRTCRKAWRSSWAPRASPTRTSSSGTASSTAEGNCSVTDARRTMAVTAVVLLTTTLAACTKHTPVATSTPSPTVSATPAATASPSSTVTVPVTVAPTTPAAIPTTPPAPAPTTPVAAKPAALDHIAVIVMENHSYGEVIGSSSAPYTNSLGHT